MAITHDEATWDSPHTVAAATVTAAMLASDVSSTFAPASVYTALPNDTLAMAFATNSAVKLTVTDNRTITTTVPAAGKHRTLIILTAGTSTFTITFGTGFKPVSSTLATGTADAKVFVLEFVSDGTVLYEVSRTTAMTA